MDHPLPPRDHNNPPVDPVSDATAPWQDDLTEAEGWLDGRPVDTYGQLVAAEALLAAAKAAAKAHDAARKAATDPLHAAWQAEIARWRPTGEHIDRIVKGLKAIIDPYKRRKDAEAQAAKRAAWAEAERARLAAEAAARQATDADLASQMDAAAAQAEAEAAQARLVAAEAAKQKGMRTYTVTEVIDLTAWARIAWKEHRDECDEFFRDLARRHGPHIPGVVETRKERRVA